MMQLETEQRVGAQGYKKTRKKKKKKSLRLNNAKGKPRFHQKMQCSSTGRIYVFICLLLGSSEEQRAPKTEPIIWGNSSDKRLKPFL